jgi:hypothetical protein
MGLKEGEQQMNTPLKRSGAGFRNGSTLSPRNLRERKKVGEPTILDKPGGNCDFPQVKAQGTGGKQSRRGHWRFLGMTESQWAGPFNN